MNSKLTIPVVKTILMDIEDKLTHDEVSRISSDAHMHLLINMSFTSAIMIGILVNKEIKDELSNGFEIDYHSVEFKIYSHGETYKTAISRLPLLMDSEETLINKMPQLNKVIVDNTNPELTDIINSPFMLLNYAYGLDDSIDAFMQFVDKNKNELNQCSFKDIFNRLEQLLKAFNSILIDYKPEGINLKYTSTKLLTEDILEIKVNKLTEGTLFDVTYVG